MTIYLKQTSGPSACNTCNDIVIAATIKGYNKVAVAQKKGRDLFFLTELQPSDNTNNADMVGGRYVVIGRTLTASIIFEHFVESKRHGACIPAPPTLPACCAPQEIAECNIHIDNVIIANNRKDLAGAIKIYVDEGFEQSNLTKTPEFSIASLEGRVVYWSDIKDSIYW